MKKDILVKLSIILLAWATMADNVITPISVNIMESFPHMTNFEFNFMLSGSMLISIPFAIIFGKLAQVIGKKYLLIFGYALYTVASLLPIFFSSLGVLLFARACAGVTCGCLGACVFSLIAELYRDERVSSTLIGFYNAFSGLAGVVIATAAGYLALVNWHNAFWTCAFGIVCLVLIIVFLPSVPPEGKAQESGVKERVPRRVWWYAISTAVYCGLCMPVFYFIAIYVTEAAIGDSATAGILTSMLTIGSFIAGVVFGFVFRKLKLFTETMFYFLSAAGIILLYFISGTIVAGAIIIIIGFGYGSCLSYYYMVSTMYAPASKTAFASGMINAALGLGCFGCTYIVLFFQSVVKIANITGVFLACGICMAAFGVVATVIAKYYTNVDKKAAVECGDENISPSEETISVS